MRVVTTLLAGMAVASMAATAEAKLISRVTGPAEYPPASFTGNYYVDSKGCAFIRAGGANVVWVPRAERNRHQVCGQTPTLANVAPTATTTTTTARRPVETAPTATLPVTVTTSVESDVPRRVQRVDWYAFWFGTPKRRTVTTPAPAPTVVAVAPVVTQPVARERRVSVAVPVATPTRTTYQGRYAIRTGPQAVHPADAVRGRTTTVAVTRGDAFTPPPGYVSLLAADRSAATRGVGTAEGAAMMDLVWTDTMPRKLIDARTGRDVTSELANVRYPYTTIAASGSYATVNGTVRYDLAPTTRTGTTRVKPPVTDEASPVNMIRRIEDTSASVADGSVTPAPVASATQAYVQVATFGVPANAARTLARFGAVGLPTARRPVARNGRSLEIVLLGPFTSQVELDIALKAARNAGFTDAFAVR